MTTKRYSEEKLKRQVELEVEGVERGIEHYQRLKEKAKEEGKLTDLPSGYGLLQLAIEPLITAIDDYKIPRRGGMWTARTRTFLQQFDSVEAAFIIARTMINAVSDTTNLQTPSIKIVKHLIDHLEYVRFKAEMPKYLKAIEKDLDSRGSTEIHRRKVILAAKHRMVGYEENSYSKTDKLQIGAKLINLFIENTGLVEKVRDIETSGWLLQPTEVATQWLEKQDEVIELLNPVYLPMIIEPVDWTALFAGGFLSNTQSYKLKLVKTRNKEALEALTNKEMPEVYESVNHLQKTPWRINKRILQIIEEAKQVSSGLAGLPRPDDEPKPPKPWNSDEEFEYYKENRPEIIKEYNKKAEAVEMRRRTEKGRRIALALKMNIARQFKNEPEMFFVYTLDFRGRVYPVQSYLNPQGDDVSKGLLEFSEGKPLTDRGVYWLKVQLANKYGVDKVSFEDRVAWVDEHEQYILDSARRPLNGEKFWTEADSPFQFLAACFEYLGYHEEGSSYISHLPIAMDGTCNGLQHFSAMLKDRKGAKATNLLPSEKPQDIYQEVVNVVNVLLSKEAMNEDVSQEDRDLASLWLGKVDRGIAKRNVMTIPYAVTIMGMKDQIREELAKRDGALGEVGAYLGVEDNFQAAYYLAKKIKEAVDEVVIASNDAKEYLQDITRILSKLEKPVYWETPTGFLAYQNYIKQKSTTVNTFWGKSRVKVRLGLRLDTDDLDKRKQAAAISPNFVHSFDAAHLMKTINRAAEEIGIKSFATIHDSFGVHACHTETFNQIIREEFSKQYSKDILKEWTENIKVQLPQELINKLPKLPKQGNLDITKVVESDYFFA